MSGFGSVFYPILYCSETCGGRASVHELKYFEGDVFS